MARSPVRELVDREMGGKLDRYLVGMRSKGKSFEAIAIDIRERTRITVTSATVRNWCMAEAARS